jgi:hypothetical protein
MEKNRQLPNKPKLAPPYLKRRRYMKNPCAESTPAKYSEICGKAFSSKSTLDRHMINEHESAERKE